MYRQASRLKLRFESKYGKLSVEALWDLSLSDLRGMVTKIHEAIKKLDVVDSDLLFLDEDPTKKTENTEIELLNLKFRILKDIYTTKVSEIKSAKEDNEKRREINRLEDILAEKKLEAEKNMSIEDLEKKIKELREK